MSKNMTRKGLALGTTFALGVTTLSAVPAFGYGLADETLVSLSPETGTEYAVLTDQYFDLKSNIAESIDDSGNLRFLVEDTDAQLVFDVDRNGTGSNDAAQTTRYGIDETDGDTSFISEAIGDGSGLGIVTVDSTDTSFAVTGHGLADNTAVKITGITDGDTAGEGTMKDGADITGSVYLATETDADNFTIPFPSSGTTDMGGTLTVERLAVANSTTSITFFTGAAHQFVVGDTLEGSGFAGSDAGKLNVATHEVTAVTSDSFTIKLASEMTITNLDNLFDAAYDLQRVNSTSLEGVDYLNEAPFASDYLLPNVASAMTTVEGWDSMSGARKSATDGSFVVDTATTANTTDQILRLVNTDTTETYSVDVTAWVDTNGDGAIDSTEYASPTRTIHFLETDDLTVSTTFTPSVGDSNFEATFTTSPVLNGQQVDAQDGNDASALRVLFTRQDSTSSSNDSTDSNTTWDDDDKEWTATFTAAASSWADLTNPATGSSTTIAHASDVATVTNNGHNLRAGDKIEFGDSITSTDAATQTLLRAGTFVVATVIDANKFTFALEGDSTIAGTEEYTVETYSSNDGIVNRIFPGTHTAQVLIGTTPTKLGTLATAIVGTTVSAGTEISVAGTTNVSPGLFDDVSGSNDIFVREDTTSVSMSAEVTDNDGDPVEAGRSVEVALSGATGTFTINGLDKTSVDLTTDSNGMVSWTVEENDGDSSAVVTVTVTPEGQDASAASADLVWDPESYTLYDLNNNSGSFKEFRTIQEDGSYTFAFALLDQWKVGPDDGDYRLKVVNADRTVSSSFHELSNGRVNVTVTDTAQSSGTQIDTDITVQKLDSNGTTYTAQNSVSWDGNGAGESDIQINVVDTATKVLLDVDGSTLYGSDTADLTDDTAAKATVAQDRIEAYGVQPAYDGGTSNANTVMVTGRIVNATTSAGLVGGLVTLSGPSNILFSENGGSVDEFGSTTVITGANGEFAVELFSNVAQEDTEITVTPQDGGAASTVEVTFNAVASTAGSNIDIDAPAYVDPGSTFQVTATITDANGNPVEVTENSDAALADVRVTYTGPGIVFGTLPAKTDEDGKLTFAVLLGANDSGTATVTVSYDRNGDEDYKDFTGLTPDVVVSQTITVGEAPVTQKVNAGSFKGYVAVYALGYEGSRLSAKIGNDWVIVDPIVNNESDNLFRVTDFTGAGVDIAVRIYIDRVLIDTINLTTK